jgi:hypothetical protein
MDNNTSEPRRKKSKWDDLADAEDLEVSKERKRVKKAEVLQAKLGREREALAARGRGAAGNGSADSSPGGSRVGAGMGRNGDGGRAGGVGRDGVRKVRELHPTLESCRSVYCYEVSIV